MNGTEPRPEHNQGSAATPAGDDQNQSTLPGAAPEGTSPPSGEASVPPSEASVPEASAPPAAAADTPASSMAGGPAAATPVEPEAGGKGSGSSMPLVLGIAFVVALVVAGFVTRDRWLPVISGETAAPVSQQATAPAAPAEKPAPAGSPAAPAGDTAKPMGGEPAPAPAQQEAGTAARLSELEQSVSTLKQQVDKLSAPNAELTKTVDALAQRITRLEQMGAQIGALDQRLGNVETQVVTTRAVATTTDRAATVVAVSQLAEAARGSGPFTRELSNVSHLVGDDSVMNNAIRQLQPLAEKGVPSIIELQLQFRAVAQAVKQASWQAQGGTWIDRTVNRLASLVTIRQTGGDAVAAGGVDAVLARSEAAVNAGDLQGAVSSLDQLSGEMELAAATPWMAAVNNRTAVNGLIDTLQQRAIARLMNRQG